MSDKLYNDLSPEEKIDLWTKQQALDQDAYKAEEQNYLASIKPKQEEKDKLVIKDKNKITQEIDSLEIDDRDKNYLKLLAKKESGFQPDIVNRFGYSGLYQFGKSALSAVNISRDDYMANSMLQHEAALKLANINNKGLSKYYGKTLNGIKLSPYNLAAAAHLIGKGDLINVLEGRKSDVKDGNQVSLFKYLKDFENI